jgi:hypothetical protein
VCPIAATEADRYEAPVLQVVVEDRHVRRRIESPRVFDTRRAAAFGAKLGADVRLGGSPWSLAAAATWVATSLGVQRVPVPAASVDYDPIFLSLGVGYRF